MIQKQMVQLIRENITLQPVSVLKNKAIQHLNNKAECLDTYINGKTGSEIRFYTMGDSFIHLGYPLLPSTGYIDVFDLLRWKHGLILRFPDIWGPRTLPVFIEQKKLFHVFHEFGKWEQILEIEKICSLNQMIEDNTVSELIKICEGLHEKKISIIADQVEQKLKNRRLILIAGPSSSGKTTFTKRLFIQLRVNELRPVIISLDDYFLNKAQTPKDKDGQPNFESPQAIDIIQLNGDLMNLLDGKTVRIPNYDFKTGKRIPGEEYTLEKHQPILIEGIHALNDQLTPSFLQKMKFKIYISALTQLNITDLLRIHTSDIRLLRRLVRDQQFRDHPPIYTLENWLNVRQGEETYIFPFQEEAATIFNTALPYELAVLKTFAQPLLESIPQKESAFTEGQRLLDLLLHVDPIPPSEVPSNSILREFIGHSSFDY